MWHIFSLENHKLKEGAMMMNWSIKDERSYKEVLHIRLPIRIKNELKRLANQKGLTLSDIIRLSLERFLEEAQRENAEKQS
jgi:hypothetical protein